MCDVVVASSRSTFSTPGVSLGLFCSTPGVAVARSVPQKVAAYMLYTGLSITAHEALTAGLVSRVVEADMLGKHLFQYVCFTRRSFHFCLNPATDSETERIVQSIKEKSLPVIRLGKKFLKQQVKLEIMEAYK